MRTRTTVSHSHFLQSLVGVGVLVLALLLALGAWGIPSQAGYAGIGPNFLPWLVAAALAVCGLRLVIKARRGGFRNMDEHDGEHPYWLGFAWLSVGMLLNAALLTTIGFIFSCALCFVLAARGFRLAQGADLADPRSWVIDGVIGLLIAGPVYWMFTQFLGINLPGLTESGWL